MPKKRTFIYWRKVTLLLYAYNGDKTYIHYVKNKFTPVDISDMHPVIISMGSISKVYDMGDEFVNKIYKGRKYPALAAEKVDFEKLKVKTASF